MVELSKINTICFELINAYLGKNRLKHTPRIT